MFPRYGSEEELDIDDPLKFMDEPKYPLKQGESEGDVEDEEDESETEEEDNEKEEDDYDSDGDDEDDQKIPLFS